MMTNVRRLKRWVVLADAPIYPYPEIGLVYMEKYANETYR